VIRPGAYEEFRIRKFVSGHRFSGAEGYKEKKAALAAELKAKS
jgi:hypothetical protein